MICLAEFEGVWQIERRIQDHRVGQEGRFAGQAVFSASAEGLTYQERGQLTLGAGPAMVAERTYLWRQDDARIIVLFEDGRPFHDFAPGSEQEARHLCGADVYDVTYRFDDWPNWSARWSVSGPKKGYTMVSHYAR